MRTSHTPPHPPPPKGFEPLPTQMVPPLCYFEISIFGDGPKIFLKAPLASIYINFEGERAQKKRDFLFKIFQKVPKNAFFDLIFKTFAYGAENFGVFSALGKVEKSV